MPATTPKLWELCLAPPYGGDLVQMPWPRVAPQTSFFALSATVQDLNSVDGISVIEEF